MSKIECLDSSKPDLCVAINGAALQNTDGAILKLINASACDDSNLTKSGLLQTITMQDGCTALPEPLKMSGPTIITDATISTNSKQATGNPGGHLFYAPDCDFDIDKYLHTPILEAPIFEDGGSWILGGGECSAPEPMSEKTKAARQDETDERARIDKTLNKYWDQIDQSHWYTAGKDGELSKDEIVAFLSSDASKQLSPEEMKDFVEVLRRFDKIQSAENVGWEFESHNITNGDVEHYAKGEIATYDKFEGWIKIEDPDVPGWQSPFTWHHKITGKDLLL